MTYMPADNLWPTPPNLSGGRLLHDFNLWPTIHMFMFCSGAVMPIPQKDRQRVSAIIRDIAPVAGIIRVPLILEVLHRFGPKG
jgi:hypothetical protein